MLPVPYIPPPNRVCLMAWVWFDGQTLYREIIDADLEDRRVWISGNPPGLRIGIPFRHVQSVALCLGNSTLEAYGRPTQEVPNWMQCIEVSQCAP
jgi:hypothetical protein